jgi:hypothetical protein
MSEGGDPKVTYARRRRSWGDLCQREEILRWPMSEGGDPEVTYVRGKRSWGDLCQREEILRWPMPEGGDPEVQVLRKFLLHWSGFKMFPGHCPRPRGFVISVRAFLLIISLVVTMLLKNCWKWRYILIILTHEKMFLYRFFCGLVYYIHWLLNFAEPTSVEQELPEHLSSPRVFSGVRVTLSF